MTHQIDFPAPDANLYGEIARLWNANAVGRHAFYPWSGELLADILTDSSGNPVGKLAVARGNAGELAGFLHFDEIREDGYPHAGVIEMLIVDSAYRRQGIGQALLDAAVTRLKSLRLMRPAFIDALGAWPYGYGFNTLADGSERSGVFLTEPALYRLFRRAGFEPVRQSKVMRVEIDRANIRPAPLGCGFYINRRTERSWLDRVFRGRELWDHDLVQPDGRILSRAIFGFMQGESRREGKMIFSLFGVNTPRDQQGRGYASANLSHMLSYIQSLGGEVVELHVYADNSPALALYEGLGFQPIAETVMMHKRL